MTAATAPGDPRFVALDGVRGMAALAVVAYHTALLTEFMTRNSAGYIVGRFSVAVPIFFVLSGFLIYRPFVLRRLGLAPPVSIADYSRRRVLRILPAYYVALIITALITDVGGIRTGVTGVLTDRIWVFLGLLQVYSAEDQTHGLAVSWTICVEITFYLLLPFWAMLWTRHPSDRSLRVELATLAALGLASTALRTWVAERTKESLDMVHWLVVLPTNFAWLAGGMALAVVHARWGLKPLTSRPWLCSGVALATFLVLALPAVGLPRDPTVLRHEGPVALEHLGYLLIAMLIVGPATDPRGVHRLLASRPVVFVGTVSYSLYLWHVPVMFVAIDLKVHHVTERFPYLAYTVIVVAASMVLATVSYKLIEKPFIDWGSRLRRRRTYPPAAMGVNTASEPGRG